MTRRVIDLSHHNRDHGPINWQAVDHGLGGVRGAYVKASEGASYVDPDCDELYAGARSIGLPVGPYHFCDGGNPIDEANHFASVVLSHAWQMAPTADVEKATLTQAWVRAFRDQFRARMRGTAWAVRFRVYLMYALMRGNLNPDGWTDANTSLWVARYNRTLGMTQAEFDRWHAVMWQNTSTANERGFVGSVDDDQLLNGWIPAADLAAATEEDDMGFDLSTKLPPIRMADGKTYELTGVDVLCGLAEFISGNGTPVAGQTAHPQGQYNGRIINLARIDANVAKIAGALPADQAELLAAIDAHTAGTASPAQLQDALRAVLGDGVHVTITPDAGP